MPLYKSKIVVIDDLHIEVNNRVFISKDRFNELVKELQEILNDIRRSIEEWENVYEDLSKETNN